MHICFITNEYPMKGINGGGIGSLVQFLSRMLVKKDIKVSVIGISKESVKSIFPLEWEGFDCDVSVIKLIFFCISCCIGALSIL